VVRYAARAVPWVRVGSAALVVLVLMEVVRRWPWQMWPLQGTAVGLLAGATAWCFDETSAAVVDTAPRRLAWRSAARTSGVLVLAGSWVVAVFRARDSLFDHPGDVTWQGLVAMLAAAAYASSRRRAGEATPGLGLALVVVPLLTAWALVRPFWQSLPVFPYADGGGASGDWETSRVLWSCLGAVALLVLVSALAEVRRRPRLVGRMSTAATVRPDETSDGWSPRRGMG